MRNSTEATESTTSAGKPASCMMVIGTPFGGRRNSVDSVSTIVSPPTFALSNMKP